MTSRRPTSGSRRKSQKRSDRPRPPFPHKILSSQSIATMMMWLSSYHKSVGQSRVCQKYVFGGAHSDVIIVGSAYSNVSSAYSNVNIVRAIWPFLYDILPESSFHRILPFDLCSSELFCLVHF